VSLSRRLSARDVILAVDACARKLRAAVCPLWGVPYRPVNVFTDIAALPPLTTDPVFLIDTPGDKSVWGSHFRTVTPVARVFVDPILDVDGGNGVVLADMFDPQRPSVASVLDHELIEMTVDPDLDRYALDAAGNEYPVEPADAVQRWQVMGRADAPGGGTKIVMLSDFVLPSYFTVGSPGPWNYGGTVDNSGSALTGPFTIAPGGYSVKNGDPVFGRTAAGQATFPEAWRQAARASMRRQRRADSKRQPIYLHP
jgi:hypothetical protein